MMFGYGHAGGGPGWGAAITLLGVIVVVGLLSWAAYAVARTRSRRHGPGGDTADPGSILDERLARGEIDADEYTRLREVMGLRQAPARPAGR
jgi:uncharacterized membrane protein